MGLMSNICTKKNDPVEKFGEEVDVEYAGVEKAAQDCVSSEYRQRCRLDRFLSKVKIEDSGARRIQGRWRGHLV